MSSEVKAMSDTFSCNFERQVARCQSEHPDIYDAHYDAIAQLKAANIVHANAPGVSVAGPARNAASAQAPQ